MTVDMAALRARLRLPVIVSPMFLVSGPEMVIAACKAGIVGSFPAANTRSAEECDGWLTRIGKALAEPGEDGSVVAPHAMNIIVRNTADNLLTDHVALAIRHRVPIVITSVGSPKPIVEPIHSYGGLVFHDVATVAHARKAIEAGVDGLILLTAGAGGHTGTANAFAFVRAVRQFWDGPLILAGGISDGYAIRAAEILGADLVYMGTRFVGTAESGASDDYKAMLLSHDMDAILTTERISGLNATFMKGSIARAGLDAAALPPTKGLFQPDLPEGVKAWRDIWSAGHGVGQIEDVPSVPDLVAALEGQYRSAHAR